MEEFDQACNAAYETRMLTSEEEIHREFGAMNKDCPAPSPETVGEEGSSTVTASEGSSASGSSGVIDMSVEATSAGSTKALSLALGSALIAMVGFL